MIYPEADGAYIVKIRRELHMYPELEFDLPRTVALVKRELDAMGISYTEAYAPSSVVAEFGPKDAKKVVGLRADMDALPINEKTGLAYASKTPGRMHACGHDAHTAMLLAAARALKEAESDLSVRVRLIFQPCEEGPRSGAKLMMENGVLDGLSMIVAQHVDMALPSGTVGVLPGVAMAASRPVIVEFFGRTAHAARPEQGCDALSMAVRCYTQMQFMMTREVNPLTEECLLNVGSLRGGETTNVVPEYARIQASLRAYSHDLEERLFERVRRMANSIAMDAGGTAKVTGELKAPPLCNNPLVCERLMKAARGAVGDGGIAECKRKISSEDFAWFTQRVPGALLRLGIHNDDKGLIHAGHENEFNVDEDALPVGANVLIRFVLSFTDTHGMPREDKRITKHRKFGRIIRCHKGSQML